MTIILILLFFTILLMIISNLLKGNKKIKYLNMKKTSQH